MLLLNAFYIIFLAIHRFFCFNQRQFSLRLGLLGPLFRCWSAGSLFRCWAWCWGVFNVLFGDVGQAFSYHCSVLVLADADRLSPTILPPWERMS